MRILIFGDSHTGALRSGCDVAQKAGSLPADFDWTIKALGSGLNMFKQFWEPRGDHALITEDEFSSRIPRLPPEGPAYDVIGLSMPMWFGRVLRHFVDCDLTLPTVADGGHVVSKALLRRMVLGDQQPTLDLMVFLRGLGIPVFVIDPPTVFRETRYLTRISEARLLGFVAAHRAIMLAELTRLGIPFVERPDQTTDADGFMRPAFKRPDPSDRHHANPRFGRLMIERIAKRAPLICQSLT